MVICPVSVKYNFVSARPPGYSWKKRSDSVRKVRALASVKSQPSHFQKPAHSWGTHRTLFCTQAPVNSFPINRLRTLAKKLGGWGRHIPEPFRPLQETQSHDLPCPAPAQSNCPDPSTTANGLPRQLDSRLSTPLSLETDSSPVITSPVQHKDRTRIAPVPCHRSRGRSERSHASANRRQTTEEKQHHGNP
jgi:hypothetical protein